MKHGRIIVLLFLLLSKFTFSQIDSAQTLISDTLLVMGDTVHATSPDKKLSGNFWSHDPHSVKQAAIFSAIIPGLGQAYNEKYWKIPIVYAALGTAGYFAYYNAQTYRDLKNTYLLRTDGDSLTADEYVNVFGTKEYTGDLSDDYLLSYIDQWKRYTDINVIVISFIYLLNIVDAVVDAHLYSFDVSNDLSLRIDPYFIPKGNYTTFSRQSFAGAGFNIKLSFK